jgi:uncharacterized protein GlcG (DUF336 family)
MRMSWLVVGVAIVGSLTLSMGVVRAEGDKDDSGSRNACKALPSWAELKAALKAAQAQNNGFLGNQMWGTIVNRDGIVCAVAFTGGNRGDQWPGSRVISAQKANTGNEFSLAAGGSSAFPTGLALSTANLYTAVQPGGSLYGLQASNPVSTDVAYNGNPANYGQANDGMVGQRVGGVNVFGGGLPLYNASGDLIGGLGVSGDTSCADHNVAYRTRHTLMLDFVPAGVSGDAARRDTIVYDITPQAGQMPGVSAGGWGHPACFAPDVTASSTLPANR